MFLAVYRAMLLTAGVIYTLKFGRVQVFKGGKVNVRRILGNGAIFRFYLTSYDKSKRNVVSFKKTSAITNFTATNSLRVINMAV